MSVPLLVRMIDSEINVINLVIAEFTNRLDHARLVREQVRARSVAIDQQAPFPDLHIKPVHGDVEFAGKLIGAELDFAHFFGIKTVRASRRFPPLQ